MRIRRLVSLLWLSAGSACVSPIHPRPARVARPGQAVVDGHLALLAFGAGEARGTLRPLDGGEARPVVVGGNSGALWDGAAIAVPPLWWEVSGRLGVFPGCEIGSLLGVFRLGGELRCALLDEREGAPLSIAASAGAAYTPLLGRAGPWARLGVDVSLAAAGAHWMGNLYLTHGIEGHRLFPSDAPDDFADPIDAGMSHDGEALPYLQVARRETRIAAAIGWGPGEGHQTFVLGLAPYFVLDAGPVSYAECGGCARFEAADFDERFGVLLTVGMAWLP